MQVDQKRNCELPRGEYPVCKGLLQVRDEDRRRMRLHQVMQKSG